MRRHALRTSLVWVLVATACGAPTRSTTAPGRSATWAPAAVPVSAAPARVAEPPPWLDDALRAPETRPEEALRALEAVVESAPDDARAHLRLARLTALWGDADAAEAHWALAAQGDPTMAAEAEAQRIRALVLARAGQISTSRALLDAAQASRSPPCRPMTRPSGRWPRAEAARLSAPRRRSQR